MKWKVQAASALLLVALVLSFVPAAATPSSVSAAQACTDRAQFVTDVTVPDGTRYEPGATFKKTWRLRNVGSCTWSTSYTMVFDSGTQMGSTASVNLPSSTAPGQTVDVSVDMTAPNTAGHYIGYWKFKNAAGTLFGIGVNANKSWWVEINVVGGSGDTGVAYDFTANAGSATWSSGAGGLTFPGNDGDAKGFALRLDNPNFESGVNASQPGLLVSPHQITNGYIQASYPEFTVQNGDRFQATVGCQAGATSCYVAYRLDYQVGNTIRTFWTFREKFEGWTYTANLNLSPLAGQSVRFILYVSAWGSPVGDRALWGNPIIARPGASPVTPVVTVTGTPPTATPTKTSGPATVPPSSCDKAQFVSDVTVPDGTVMSPGQKFTKTWRLRNVGTCAWTKSYQIVFYSGEQMGAPASLTFAQDVPVGGTADFTIEMTAPSTAGTYRGNWMFKNASGQLFGIGAQANRPWWVDIRVSGPTVTPGGPTVTPGGPTVTPGANIAYDFATNACAATWYTGAGQIPASQCPGTDGDAKGFVLRVTNPRLESGATDSRPGIITFPQNVQNGYIQGFFPTFRVQNGDRFRSVINCEYNATNCYVAFRLDYEQGGTIRTFWGPFLERYEGKFYNVDVDLSPLAGRDVKFILTVLAAGVATGDRALWVGPHIYRVGATAPTPISGTISPTPTTGTTAAPTTAVPTTPVVTTPAGTTAVPTTAVPSDTPTPTNTMGTPANSATPTPTTPGPTTGYYQNTKYNFRFSLPSGARILSQSENVGQVSLPISTAGTNLLSKTIQIHVREGVTPCVSPAVDNPLTTENVTINNISFTKQTGQGAAAGNRYDWTAYSTVDNNACISLAFVLHSANRGNYATPPPEFDKTAESAVIDATMATFSRIPS
jgi:hypothetical protein